MSSLTNAERIADGLLRREERRRKADELATKTWLASEVEDLKRDFLEDPDAKDNLVALNETVEQAKKEGRFQDDLRPSFENLRKRLGPGRWLISRAEVGLLARVAELLHDQEHGNAWSQVPGFAAEGTPGPFSVGLQRFLQYVYQGSRNGDAGISDELGLGFLFRSSMPPSARRFLEKLGGAGTVMIDEPRNDIEKRVADAQARRWPVYLKAIDVVLDGFRRGDETPAVEMMPGMRWESWNGGDAFFPAARYGQETADLERFFQTRRSETRDARKKQYQQEIANKLSAEFGR